MFDGRDRDTNAVAVISNAFAKQIFADRNPIGQRVLVSGDTRVTIIGVVGDVKYSGPGESARITLYQSFSQFPQWTFSVVARVNDDPNVLVTPLRRIVASIDPEIAVAEVRTLRDLVDASASAVRFRALVLAIFAATALLLAAIGIYGVMSFAVAARTREIGVRVALGARAGDVTAMVLRDGLVRAGLGVGIGLVGAAAVTRMMTKLLFGVTATDPATFATVSLVLLVVAAGACWLPARRAAKVDPMVALRADSGG
jgi:putative ABC transport system permease protein